MKAWWLGLAARERRILMLGGVVLALALLYVLWWRPTSQSIALSRERLGLLRADWAWMQVASAKVRALRTGGSPQATPIGGSLAAWVDGSARRLGMEQAIAQMTSVGGGAVSVSLNNADFAHLLRWLGRLSDQGIEVQRLDLAPTQTPGKVQATLLLAHAQAQ